MIFILALFATLAWAQESASPVRRQAGFADLILSNGVIYTGDAAHPQASGLAMRDGMVVSNAADLSRLRGPDTRAIDLKGATVIPGLIDAHVHMQGLGLMLETLNLRGVKTIEEVAAIVHKAAEAAKPGEWIRGRSWDQTNWGGAFPTSDPLTQAAPGNPVYLTRVDGHAGWVNRKALELAGVTKDTPDPEGGHIVRSAGGAPTGVLIDRAQNLVLAKIPPPPDQDVRRMLKRAAAECARLGLTGVHDAGIDSQTLDVYRSLLASRELPVRVYAMIGGEGALWQEYLKRGPEIGDRLTVRCIKLVSDGAMGSRGAAFWQPYADDPGNAGLLILKREDIERVARAAVEHGFQVATHAIGDRANHVTLAAYAVALGARNDKRFRIEHAQIVSPPDFALFQKFSVIASMQSTHATSDMRWAAARLGPDRLQGAYAQKKMLQLGIPLANGSDFPVEDPNPLWGFYAAVSRKDRDGNPPGGWMPDQKLTRREALASWTTGPAYAAFEDDKKGTLTAGKMADCTVLSKDIMTIPERDILSTRVLYTILGGKVVHQESK